MSTDARQHKDRKVLIVAPHFPPATLAGVHRSRHLAKWLPSHGWTPIILRVDERDYSESLDPVLAQLVPDTVIQERVQAISHRFTAKIGFSDVSIRAYRQLRKGVARAIAKYRPEVVLITGSPFYPMMFSGWIKREFGIPVVLDFQDPWVSAWGETLPRWSKGGIAHRLATILEPKALRHADYVTSVSDRQNEELAARYPWLDATRMAGIPIGGDPEDFVLLRELGAGGGGRDLLDPDKATISYVGTLLPRAEQVLRRLFRALRSLTEEKPELAARLQLKFIGSSNQPNGTTKVVMPVAEQEGVAQFVDEMPARVPFADALRVLAQSHGTLLIGSDEPHYTASKIYPVLMSGTPFLSLFHSASSAHKILTAAGGGKTIDFTTLDELDTSLPDIAQGLETLATNPSSLGKPDPEHYRDFTAHAVAGRFAAIFDELSR